MPNELMPSQLLAPPRTTPMPGISTIISKKKTDQQRNLAVFLPNPKIDPRCEVHGSKPQTGKKQLTLHKIKLIAIVMKSEDGACTVYHDDSDGQQGQNTDKQPQIGRLAVLVHGKATSYILSRGFSTPLLKGYAPPL